jgi:sterol desaturase/sphingolipid hydroxylase (fatty acid hydroxylase superfamily)
VWALPLLAALWIVGMPSLPLALTGLAVFLTLSLNYEWVHYLTHTRYRPRSRWYRRLWRNHRLHHCKNEHLWYGVTMLSADVVLGTSASPHDVERSKTVRTVGPL